MYNKLPNVCTDLKLFSDLNELSPEFGLKIMSDKHFGVEFSLDTVNYSIAIE